MSRLWHGMPLPLPLLPPPTMHSLIWRLASCGCGATMMALESAPMIAAVALAMVALPGGAALPAQCAKSEPGLCLTHSQPILKTFYNSSTQLCCQACVADTRCVAWNTNDRHRGSTWCYLRAEYLTNPGPQCTCGKVREGPPAPPSPAPPVPSPPHPPIGPPPPSDQQPRYHFMPHGIPGFSNDIQGPFFDARHKLYHMGFAWHPNSSSFSGAPNHWFHIVSSDLARWTVVSKTIDDAMLKPGNWTSKKTGLEYCKGKPTTGSVTIVDGIPTALFSCNGQGGTTIAKAVPTNLSDPHYTHWTMDVGNPVMTYPAGKGGRDPATAWQSRGLWRTISACEANCSEQPGLSAAAALWSSPDFEAWTFEGTLYGFNGSVVECPEFYTLPVLGGGAGAGAGAAAAAGGGGGEVVHMLKASYTGKEIAFVGRYDEQRQQLVDLGGPAEVEGGQRLDAGPVYASKSFWDPQNQQRVWSAWVKNEWFDDQEASLPPLQGEDGRYDGKRLTANISLAGAHTLPRSLIWDPNLKRVVTPPIPQLDALRIKALATINRSTVIAPSTSLSLLPGVVGMQLEVHSTWAIPAGPTTGSISFGVALRVNGEQTQRTDCGVRVDPGRRNTSLITRVNNTGAIVDSVRCHQAGNNCGEEVRALFELART
jgi:sucrose-6-phosphate hydrolase SacC (GH32 family)